MSTLSMFGRLAIVSAGIVIAAVAACTIQLRGDKDAATTPLVEVPAKSSLASSLTRCRAVTLDQTAVYEDCCRVWAENRRLFFGKKPEATSTTVGAESGQLPDLAPKDESRLPQGGLPGTQQEQAKP